MGIALDRGAIAALCRRHRVKKLTIFGSATTPEFDPHRSDVDFLAEFQDDAGLSNYFGLKTDLESLLGRPVDLVSPRALENPSFAATARETAEDVYAA